MTGHRREATEGLRGLRGAARADLTPFLDRAAEVVEAAFAAETREDVLGLLEEIHSVLATGP